MYIFYGLQDDIDDQMLYEMFYQLKVQHNIWMLNRMKALLNSSLRQFLKS